jgi:hypothetical protein
MAENFRPETMLIHGARRANPTSAVAPPRSSTALMICTQVVAIIPPNSTYASMTTPTMTTAASYGIPNRSRIRFPAPTICAIR